MTAKVPSPVWNGIAFFDLNGNILAGGELYTYAGQSFTVKQTTYTDITGNTPNTNPIKLNISGRMDTGFWLTPNVFYNFKLTDANENIIAIEENIYGAAFLPPGVPTINASCGLVPATPTITWSTSSIGTYAIASYQIWRSLTMVGGYTLLNTVSGSTLMNIDTTAVAGTSYFYYIVAVDSQGNLSSPSGVQECTTPSPPSNAYRGVLGNKVTANNTAVVGDGGHIKLSPSPTTNVFASVTSGVSTRLNGAQYVHQVSNGLAVSDVVVGAGGVILTSNNESTWTSHSSGTINDLYGVSAQFNIGTSIFVCGANGTILSSLDGSVWANVSSGSALLRATTFDGFNGNYVFVVGDGGVILATTDGTTWLPQTTSDSTTNNLYGATTTTNNSTIGAIAVGAGGVIYTTDGSTTVWTKRTSGVITDLFGVFCYQNDPSTKTNGIVAVGAGGVILSSSDGITWTSRVSGTSEDLYAVTNCGYDDYFISGQAVSGNFWTAVGANGTIRVSTDAVTWSAPATGTLPIYLHADNPSTGPIATSPLNTTISGSGDGFQDSNTIGPLNGGFGSGGVFPLALLGNTLTVIGWASSYTGHSHGAIVVAVNATVSQSLFTSLSFVASDTLTKTYTSASAVFDTTSYAGYSIWYWASDINFPFNSTYVTFTI